VKKVLGILFSTLMTAAGFLLIMKFQLFPPILSGLLLSSLGITLLLDQLRGRLIKRAPDYRYRAQELGVIFRGPPR
jgi:hypothetical protein